MSHTTLKDRSIKLNEMDLTNVATEDFDKKESERAIRQAQIAELDAINMYDQIAQSVSNPKIKELFLDIAEEEKVHQGEFLAAASELDPDDSQIIEDGKDEAADTLKEALEDFHKDFPELSEGFASTIGRGIGNIGRGIKSVGRSLGNSATNFKAGFSGITDEEISELLQAFKNPRAVSKAAPATSINEPVEGAPLNISDPQDTKAYFNDVVRKLLALINSGSGSPEIKIAISQLAKEEGGLDYTKWKWANLNKLNQLGIKAFPDWTARELPPEAKNNPEDTPAEDAAGAA